MTIRFITPSWEQRLLNLAQDARCVTKEMLGTGSKTRNDPELTKAFAACEAITAKNSRSFFLASGLLPGEKRRAMRALYAFCRTADNLADGDVHQPAARLLELRQGIAGLGKLSSDAVVAAWSDIRVRYHISLCYAEQLLDGVQRDLVQRRYQTFEDLSVYCYGVASTVGLMSMQITGFSNQQAFPYAIKLGVALQLTNISRDVGEDWHSDRLYLPLSDRSYAPPICGGHARDCPASS